MNRLLVERRRKTSRHRRQGLGGLESRLAASPPPPALRMVIPQPLAQTLTRSVQHHPQVAGRDVQRMADLRRAGAQAIAHDDCMGVHPRQAPELPIQCHDELLVRQTLYGIGPGARVTDLTTVALGAVAYGSHLLIAQVGPQLVNQLVAQDAEQPGSHSGWFDEVRPAFQGGEQGFGNGIFGPVLVPEAAAGGSKQSGMHVDQLARKVIHVAQRG